jgi:glycosyltransferase involved in cell wall biosynthesis
MKIVALLPVKNEEWCLEHCLKSLSFTDLIIAIDDNSTDSTLEILKKYNCKVVTFETMTNVGWKEYEIRTKLLEIGREENATHIISIDADESCSLEFQKNARAFFGLLKPGQTLELEWLNLCSKTSYKKPKNFKAFGFYDDKISKYPNGFIGIPRVPNTNIKPLRITRNNLIFHYQFIDSERCIYKQIWYMISEFLKKERSAKKINNLYNHTQHYKCKKIKDVKNIPQSLPPINYNKIWQKEEVYKKIKECGIEFFEPLDIWNIKELREEFIKKVGRNPKPTKFPIFLVKLNNIKNILKKYLRN